MDERLHGVLLAVSGDDSDLLRAIDARGSGLRVVRRCADAADLLSAAMAGLASSSRPSVSTSRAETVKT